MLDRNTPLRMSASLWSADLTRLGTEIARVDPYVDAYHFDVADGHHTPTLLFFPDLIHAVRSLSKRLFEVHLMVSDPRAWIEIFAQAGADRLIFCLDSVRRQLPELLEATRRSGLGTGLSLALNEPLSVVPQEVWPRIDLLTILGTPMGVKGFPGIDPAALRKLEQARRLRDEQGLLFELQLDGGVRDHTVPSIRQAGADWIVPGSLLFGCENPELLVQWIQAL